MKTGLPWALFLLGLLPALSSGQLFQDPPFTVDPGAASAGASFQGTSDLDLFVPELKGGVAEAPFLVGTFNVEAGK